ncbi:MAG: serine acetyltransferase [Gammaproteobacteria bacterium]|nr:serine acetyltransferase [Gammaproteobacteria bacterium]
MFENLREDFRVNREGLTRVVILVFRFGAWSLRMPVLLSIPFLVMYRVLNLLLLRLAVGIDMPARLIVGPGLRLHHAGRGISIHSAATIGSNVTIFQDVAIGTRTGIGAPSIGDRVRIAAGAKVLGPISIGQSAQIGANAVVVHDVPANWIALAPVAEIRARSKVID